VRLLGVAALAGVVQYVVTPTTALGPRREPVLFASNVAYVVPALVLGAVLLPIAWERVSAKAATVLAVGLAAVVAVEWLGRDVPAWDTANAAIALVLVAAGVGVVAGARVLSRRSSAALVAASLVVVLGALPVGWLVARHYLRDRWAGRPVYTWAKTVSGSRIAVAGFIQQYPLTGTKLDNRVQYVGVRGPHGEFHEIGDCAAWRQALRSGRYDYVVLGRESPDAGLDARRRDWTAADPAASQVLDSGGGVVYRFDWRAPDPAC
jgi:hypothetical protein